MTAGSRLAVLLTATVLAGCSGSAPAPPTPPPSAAAPTPASTGRASPAATTHAPPLAGCPTTPAAATSLPVLYRGPRPDDLTVAADGALWLSNSSTNVARVLDGRITRSIAGFEEPEGVVPLPDGDVVVADQGHQRIVDVHADGTRSVLLSLPPVPSGVLGVDGIGWDPRAQVLLIPDSPHGVLYSLDPAKPGQPTQLASGLPRAVGVETAIDGGIWLAAEAEAPRGLLHLAPGAGAATPVGRLAQLDDVVLVGRLLYATNLRSHSVDAVDPATGAARTIATGFGEPQGMVLLPDGNLAVADSPRGVVQRLAPCAP